MIELGNEEYHGELVHDEKEGKVTIYLLDSAAKEATPIDDSEIMVNVSRSGEGRQYALSAEPLEGEPAGQSSRFASVDEELAADLDHEEAQAHLVVKIAGKQFRGEISHHHDHAGHNHP